MQINHVLPSYSRLCMYLFQTHYLLITNKRIVFVFSYIPTMDSALQKIMLFASSLNKHHLLLQFPALFTCCVSNSGFNCHLFLWYILFLCPWLLINMTLFLLLLFFILSFTKGSPRHGWNFVRYWRDFLRGRWHVSGFVPAGKCCSCSLVEWLGKNL